MNGDSIEKALRPDSRALFPTERYPQFTERQHVVPLANGGGTGVLQNHMEYCIVTDGVESFYFAVNFILTRPEVIYKRVYTSYITEFKYEATSVLGADFGEDLFFRLIRQNELQYFLDGRLKKVELERVWVIDNPELSLVTLYEIWDFEKKIIRYGPKVRTEFQEEEAAYNGLIPLMEVEIAYHTRDEEARVSPYGIHPDDSGGIRMLEIAMDTLIDKIFEMCTPYQWEIKNGGFRNHPTLVCVDRERYLQTYRSLKQEHFEELAALWTRLEESTDFRKYIPEDLHIATYLNCLQTSIKSPVRFAKKFIDLGCGNGLLTHLLTQSGWSGYGVDSRKRNLWAEFSGRGADLQELTVAYNTTLRGVDAETILIGNHPDELCPLIPLLARQTGAAGFIIIPCCAFDVFGKKYIRGNSDFSVYESHLRALRTLCTRLGFDVKIDKLRIPSTKRVAIVGGVRTRESRNGEPDSDAAQAAFDELMNELDAQQPGDHLPREKSLKVNNCTQLCRETCETIIKEIFDCIYFSNCNQCNECYKLADLNWGVTWHLGCEKITIGMLASILPESRLKFLKGQGNGLRTLLKNYSEIFKIHGEFVRIHFPEENYKQKMIDMGKAKKLGKKPCFFHFQYPLGCTLRASECAFSHVPSIFKPTVTVEQFPRRHFYLGKPVLTPGQITKTDDFDPYGADSDDEVGMEDSYETAEPDFEDDFANCPVLYL